MANTTGVTQYARDLDGQLDLVTRPDGSTIDYDPDSAGRLWTTTLPVGEGQLVRAYDPATGKLASITGPDPSITLSTLYDGSLVTDTVWSGLYAGQDVRVHRAYDDDFRPVCECINGLCDVVAGACAGVTDGVVPAGQYPVGLGYDLDGLLTSAGGLSLTPNAQNGLLDGTNLGVVSETFTPRNGYGEVVTYEANDGSPGGPNLLLSFDYVRDDLGRITQKTETVLGEVSYETHETTYGYDAAGRLVDVYVDGTSAADHMAHYVYDDSGDRLAVESPNQTIVEAQGVYDEQNRLVAYGGLEYEHTANGQRSKKTDPLSGDVTLYQYDALGSLRSVTLPDTTVIDYVIDGEGRRIGKKVDGVLVQGWVYADALRIAAQLDGSGNVVARYVYGERVNVPEAMITASGTYRILSDHLGSPRLVVDAATGVVVGRMDYDVFGNLTPGSDVGVVPFAFAGGLYDEDTGLVRFGARDYDPVVGRWTDKDPIGFGAGDTNLYGYVFSDPVNAVDPSGLYLAPAALVAIAGAIAVYLDTYIEPGLDAENSGLPGGWNGQQDAYRHCLASCVATAHYGESVSTFLSWLNGGSPADPGEQMDAHNDRMGRELCGNGGDNAGIDYCRQACMEALSSGQLQNVPEAPDEKENTAPWVVSRSGGVSRIPRNGRIVPSNHYPKRAQGSYFGVARGCARNGERGRRPGRRCGHQNLAGSLAQL